MGRPRKPIESLKLVASARTQYRRAEEVAIKPSQRRPEPPAYMSGEAVAIFAETCDLLAEMGILSRSDAGEIERYANAQAGYRKAQAGIDANGSTQRVETKSGGYESPSVSVQLAGKWFAEAQKSADRLGLNPRGRNSVSCKIETNPSLVLHRRRS